MSISDIVNETRDWLKSNSHESEATKEDYEEQHSKVKAVCEPIVSKLCQAGGQQQSDDEDFEDI